MESAHPSSELEKFFDPPLGLLPRPAEAAATGLDQAAGIGSRTGDASNSASRIGEVGTPPTSNRAQACVLGRSRTSPESN
jgi:hypothetical protein